MIVRITNWSGPSGYDETGIYQGDTLVAVITHPGGGRRWFVYPVSDDRRQTFTTRREAMTAALDLTDRNVGDPS